jgi:para-nitrobenzyl esterase
MTDLKRRGGAHLVAGIFASLASAAMAAPAPTESGLVEGVEEKGARVYKGIPFAAPPVGPLRWRAPQPAASWQGVRIADRFSPICPQQGAYPEDSPEEPMSEDCLYLNIWTPSAAPAGPLPVMVWIYGGGLVNGSASTPLYWGEALARRGVIVVTANYRLGALGFLAHPALSQESPAEASGNYGLLDQLAALGWVKRNIAAFGGDPDNVTVFGQSSGAISISALLASPLADGLFRRAIGESGGLFEPIEAAPEFKLDGAEEIGLAFAERLGASSIDALRALPASDIVAPRFHPQPNVDGYVLKESPYEAFAHRRQNAVDILVGSNESEGLYFVAGRTIGAANLDAVLKEDFPPFIVALIGPGAPADDEAARAAFVAFEGDLRFGWNMWTWARLHAASRLGRTYFYRFQHAPPGEEGPTHGAEMAYVFDHLDQKSLPWTEQDRRLAAAIAAYRTNFAKTGDPNGEGRPYWPEFSPAYESTLLIGEEIRTGPVPNEKGLVAIDRLYGAVRALLTYGLALAGAAGLIVLLAAWRIGAHLLRRRPARA